MVPGVSSCLVACEFSLNTHPSQIGQRWSPKPAPKLIAHLGGGAGSAHQPTHQAPHQPLVRAHHLRWAMP